MASVQRARTKAGEARYRVRFRDPAGKSKEKWFRRRVDADRYARNVEVDMERGQYLDPASSRMTFNEVADRWLATRHRKARSTQDRDMSYLRSRVLPVFGERQVRSIRASEIEAWVVQMEGAPATRAKALQLLKSILRLAQRDGVILANPAAEVESPTAVPQREGRALDDAELGRLLAAAEDVDESTAAMVMIMGLCGLRIGEAIALRWADVNFEAGQMSLSASMSRREGVRPLKARESSEESRIVRVGVDVEDRLRLHMARYPGEPTDFVFRSPEGSPLSYTNWRRRVWVPIIRSAGIDATPHDLRRTAATRLFLVDRWVPGEVQAQLGHRDPRMTHKVYVKVNPAALPRPSSLSRV